MKTSLKTSYKQRGSLAPNQIMSRLVRHEESNLYWVKLVDLRTAELTALLRRNIIRLLEEGEIPILSSPHLSDRSAETNRCATVLKVKQIEGFICGLLKPEGRKARVFRQMIEDQRVITLTLGGVGAYDALSDDKARLMLSEVHYIRVGFIK